MLKFGLEIALGMIQKSGAAIFEILIFRDFSGGQSPKMADLDQNMDFDPLKNCEKSRFQKSPHITTPPHSFEDLSANQI